MKFSLLLLLLCGTLTARSQDLSMYQKKQFTAPDGGVLPYRILYPDNYNRNEKYPVILFLHGAGERGSDNEKQLIHGGKLFLDPVVRRKYPAIVIFPQCPADSYWSSVRIDRNVAPLALEFDYNTPITPPLANAMMLLQDVLKDESADTRRVYITGLSMGGMGTFEMVHRYPGVFAAALPICGGGDTATYKKVDLPLWVFHGDADAVVDVKYSRVMVERLKDLKVKVRYTEYPGVNHNSWDSAFAEPNYLKWMFSKRRKQNG